MFKKIASGLIGATLLVLPLTAAADTLLPSGIGQQVTICLTPPVGTSQDQIQQACTSLLQVLTTIVNQLVQLYGGQGKSDPNQVTFIPAPWWYNSYATTTVPTKVPPSITSISTTSAPIGTLVTVSGTNFTPTGNTVFFNNQVAASASTDQPTSLLFYVPTVLRPVCQAGQSCDLTSTTLTAGTYSLTISNANGKSNAIQFGVVVATSTTATTTPPNASTTLAFSASPTSGSIPLSVAFTMNALGSIAYGDGQLGAITAASGACTNSIPASCTFSTSHSYTSAGTYTAIFTPSGTSTTASITITATSTIPTTTSCTTPWGSYPVQNGGLISYQPYFSGGSYTLSVVVPLMKCASGAWQQCDFTGQNCVAWAGSNLCSSQNPPQQGCCLDRQGSKTCYRY